MKTTIKCPGCGNALEVEEEWNGCKAECPYCANKFILRLEEPLRSVAPDLTQQQNDFLLSLGCTVIVSRGHVYADISSYDPQTSMKLVMRLTGIGIQFLDRYDHDTGKYKTLAVAGEVWSASGGTWKLLSVSKKKEASDAVLQSALHLKRPDAVSALFRGSFPSCRKCSCMRRCVLFVSVLFVRWLRRGRSARVPFFS